MYADKILPHLEKVRRNGDNQWMACCPAHADSDPSLSIKETSDGRVLMHCFAGCGGAEIMGAIGMTLDDLYPDGALGELKGWHQSTNQMRNQRQAKRHAKLILDIAGAKTEPLTPLQLEEVRQARKTVRG